MATLVRGASRPLSLDPSRSVTRRLRPTTRGPAHTAVSVDPAGAGQRRPPRRARRGGGPCAGRALPRAVPGVPSDSRSPAEGSTRSSSAEAGHHPVATRRSWLAPTSPGKSANHRFTLAARIVPVSVKVPAKKNRIRCFGQPLLAAQWGAGPKRSWAVDAAVVAAVVAAAVERVAGVIDGMVPNTPMGICTQGRRLGSSRLEVPRDGPPAASSSTRAPDSRRGRSVLARERPGPLPGGLDSG